MTKHFDEWIGGRQLASLGTNSRATPVAFQSWLHFKEAFPPEVIRKAIADTPLDAEGVLDPFGGSGTTALASQFLGVPSTTVELNPFLADVIRAKVGRYDADDLSTSLGRVCRRATRLHPDAAEFFSYAPATFVQPGKDARWIFDTAVAERIAALRLAINEEQDESHRRLFTVLLGGALIELSNVIVSGKGRRYRRNWGKRVVEPRSVDQLFTDCAVAAIADVHRFGDRPRPRTTVVEGDSREVQIAGRHSTAVFSPPYPNSFDYTDVYNVELWTLGYLNDSAENRALRRSTLSSHVQIHRDFKAAPEGSRTLRASMKRLHEAREQMWSPWIPSMVGAYFTDLLTVLERSQDAMVFGGVAWMVVGDSRYAGVHVPVGKILAELAPLHDWEVQSMAPFRSMRTSAQQGREEIPESLVILKNMAIPASS
jgi:hypothetical protein